MRKRIFEIIERGKEADCTSIIYDRFMMACVFVSLIPLMYKPENVPGWLIMLDNIIGGLFAIDYILRFITEDYRRNKNSAGVFLKYPITSYAIVDLLSILPWILEIAVETYAMKPLKMLRLFRAFKVLRAFRIIRYSRSIRLTMAAVKNSEDTLCTVGMIALGYIFILALLIFNVEMDNENINSFADALYFAAVSLTTVGYGDISPGTIMGRLITVCSSFIGIAIIALPSGILTAGYMKALDDEKNNKLEIEEDE